MDNPTHADWKSVGDAFKSFGQQFRGHFDAGSSEASEAAKSAAQKASGAVDDFADAMTEAVGKLGNAINDPAVSDSAKNAVNSLIDALSNELGTKNKS